ncbi:MAG: efflux RND transporter permease subunit [Bacillota bacterium]|nr:efflux RND transporter permease subunit [Bacillota bacterium]
MSLPELAVKRPVATATILLLILVIGLVSLYQSPLDLLPDIEAPVLAVITAFPGSSPQETLELVTKPVENSVAAVSGLTGLNSFSQENLSLVILVFDWGADIKQIREDVSARMDLLSFPDGVQRPLILEFDPMLMPIMQLSASGGEDAVALTEWLKETASPRLESILGVASVQVQGGVEQDVFVRTSPDIMAEHEISFEQIANILQASLMDLPAGIVELEDRQVRIRFIGRFAEIDKLGDLVVGFHVDQDKLAEMVGEEIDIDLNQMFAGGTSSITAGGISEDVPLREIFWDDIFALDSVTLDGPDLTIPLSDNWVPEEGEEIEEILNIFTVNPALEYDPSNRSLNLSLTALGRLPLLPGDLEELSIISDDDITRLDDFWIIEEAVWDNGTLIIPLNPLKMKEQNVGTPELEALAERTPLITRATNTYLLVSLHEDWENIRNQPIISIPDYKAWLNSLQQGINSNISGASRMLEEGLNDMATAMVLNSMGYGETSMGGMEFDDDFPVTPVTLATVAEVKQDTYNPTTITRFNRQPSISLAIQKEGDANTVLVARRVRQELEALAEESVIESSPVAFNTIFDQAEEIERALADLVWALAGGAVLAVLVLIVFLKNWRTTMFIGLSIPTAIIATFTLLYFTDLTINLMTLGGLALAAGMLVDNAIVVSENIYRHYQLGESPNEAAVNGAREVAGAVTASALTTISVFFPVVFLSGLAGQIFWEFALTVACAILASLLVALTVIPLLASRSLQSGREQDKQDKLTAKPHRLFDYRNMLSFAVSRPWVIIALALLLVGMGVVGYSSLGTDLFPLPDESSFTIDITMPPGTILPVTDSYLTEIESILDEHEEISSFSSQVGGAQFMGIASERGVSNEANLRAEVDPAFIEEMDNLIDEIRKEVEAVLPAGVEAAFARESLLDTAGFDVQLELVVSGSDLNTVTDITRNAVQLLAGHPHFTDVRSSMEENRPEVHITLDQGEALQKGVTQFQVAAMVREALEGIPVSRIETDQGILNVVLGYQQDTFETLEDLGQIGFYSPSGEYLHLDEIAELTEDYGPLSIPRQDQQIVGQIEIQYSEIDLGTATNEAMEILDDLALPPGYEIKTAGSSTLMDDVLSELQLVLVVAVLLVYLVMAAQFESLLHPFIIICSLPLAYIGVIYGLIITGNAISVPALIGIVVLSGILVNDGIIMVDFINQQRRIYGLPLEKAIIEGASARLRPILMTTATTVLGLLPLALGIGEGAQLQAPMAITVIGGQITGTLLLLLVIPSIYRLTTKEQDTGVDLASANDNGEKKEMLSRKGVNGQKRSNKKIIVLVGRMILVLVIAAVVFYLFRLMG